MALAAGGCNGLSRIDPKLPVRRILPGEDWVRSGVLVGEEKSGLAGREEGTSECAEDFVGGELAVADSMKEV